MRRIRVTSHPTEGQPITTSLQWVLWGLGVRLLWGERLTEAELTRCETIGMAQVGGPVLVRHPNRCRYHERLGGVLGEMLHGLELKTAKAEERRRTWWRFQLAVMGTIQYPQFAYEWAEEIELCCDQIELVA